MSKPQFKELKFLANSLLSSLASAVITTYHVKQIKKKCCDEFKVILSMAANFVSSFACSLP